MSPRGHLSQDEPPQVAPDPLAWRHRRDLLAALRCSDADRAAEGYGPYRTPDEAEWTDAEMDAAARLRRSGVRDPETLRAAAGFERVRKRRAQGRRAGAA